MPLHIFDARTIDKEFDKDDDEEKVKVNDFPYFNVFYAMVVA